MNCYICDNSEDMERRGKVNEILPDNGVRCLICYPCAKILNKIPVKWRRENKWDDVIKIVLKKKKGGLNTTPKSAK